MKKLIGFNSIASVNLTVLDAKFTGKGNVFADLSSTFWSDYVPAKIAKYMETGAVQQINHVVMCAVVMHKKTEVVNMLKGMSCHKLQASGKFGGTQDKASKKSAVAMVDHNGKKVARWYKAYSLYIDRELDKAKTVGTEKVVTAPVLSKEALKLVKKFDKDSLESIIKQVTIAYNATHKTEAKPVKAKTKAKAKPPVKARAPRKARIPAAASTRLRGVDKKIAQLIKKTNG